MARDDYEFIYLHTYNQAALMYTLSQVFLHRHLKLTWRGTTMNSFIYIPTTKQPSFIHSPKSSCHCPHISPQPPPHLYKSSDTEESDTESSPLLRSRCPNHLNLLGGPSTRPTLNTQKTVHNLTILSRTVMFNSKARIHSRPSPG